MCACAGYPTRGLGLAVAHPLRLINFIISQSIHILLVSCQVHLMRCSLITTVAGVKRWSASVCVCVCVCPQHNSETNDPKVFKLGVETFGYPTIFMVLGQNCQRSRSQGHKLQNHNGRREFAPLSSAHCLDYQCYQPRNGTKTWNFINYGSWKSFSVHVQILLHFCVDLSDVAQRPLYLCTQLLICTLPPSNPRRKIVWTLEDKREDFQNCSVPCCVPQFYSVICTLIWAVLTGELGLLVWV